MSRKYQLNTENPAPSTGAMLDTYIKEKRIRQAALCRALNRHLSSVAVFRKGSTIQTAVLWEICHALQHNFFADIAAQLPDTYTTSAPPSHDAELDALRNEIQSLKTERDVLERMLGRFVGK
jgi:DNA-binding Xre family transcriptional regulator